MAIKLQQQHEFTQDDHGYLDLEKVWEYLLFECHRRQIITDFVLPDDERPVKTACYIHVSKSRN